MHYILFITAYTACAGFVQGQQDTALPVPCCNPKQLFYLQRTPDANTVVYELNYKNGELVSDDPVHVFWIRYSDSGQRAELNAVQRKFAYGIRSKALSAGEYELQFVSDKKLRMYLKKGADQRYYVYTRINNMQAILRRVFLKIDGGPFWSPKILYADVSGIDPASGLAINERIELNDR